MMDRILSLDFLKGFIPDQKDNISKYRPQCLYIDRPPARRKYQTVIRPPDRNFFRLMSQRNVYLWVVAKKSMENGYRQKIQESYKSVKSLSGFKKLPICQTFQECKYWVQQCPCQIVLFQDVFKQVFPNLKDLQNACGFHIISSDNVQIAKIARQNRKIRDIYDSEQFILGMVKQNMQRLAITKQEKQMEKEAIGGDQFKRLLIRNIIFPNFIKLSKHDKSEHNQYRLHLIGLRRLTQQEKMASKQKFIEFSKYEFPKDEQLIQQYSANTFQDPKEVLRFYTLDSFFYRILNNTLRIAKNTEEFFSIGEPFNRVFDSIKVQYDFANKQREEEITVYRGADLTSSQCTYLEQNVGKYIQINGFISTSKSLQTAKNFARQRKNNTIFKIHLRKVDYKYTNYDYGYVDLQLNKCSAFDQDEVLINALNVFKILEKQTQENFQVYTLEYGSIFKILRQDPNSLNENDRYAYYSFKQLKQMNEKVTDIGEVYLRTNEPEKAIEIYEFQLQKIKTSIQVVHREEVENVMVKAADAYLANGQPDKALQYYESILGKKKKRTNEKKKTLIISQVQINRDETEVYEISTKVGMIHTNSDKFEQAELNYLQNTKYIEKQLLKEWNIDILWPKIQLEWQIYQGKKSQLLYQEAFNWLKQMSANLNKSLAKMKDQYQAYQQKKIRFKLTQVYEAMAQMIQQLQTEKGSISDIRSSFNSVVSDLAPLIQKNSYEQGVLNIRRSEILRRTKQFNEQKQIDNYHHSISIIQNNTIETDKILPIVYNSFADLQKKSLKKADNTAAKMIYKKKLKIQTVIYGNDDPKPLLTKMDIAICQRDDKNTIQSLQQFDEAYHTKLFKSQDKYTSHAKILFNMAHAYTDKGDDGLALKSYDQAYLILKKRLSPKDFQKSVLRYKITLKIGRLYMSSSLRTPQSLKMAQKNLIEYHEFITQFYKYKHTDVGLSYNCLGALYSTIKKFSLSKENFLISIDIYEQALGSNSLDVAKIKSNLALCYAQLKDPSKATKTLLSSQSIFEKIYSDLRKCNPFEYESKFIKAQIQTILGQYQKAIQSCENSIQLQIQFLEAKRKNGNVKNDGSNTNINTGNPLRNDSYELQQMRKPGFHSLNINYANQLQRSNNTISPLKSQYPSRFKSQNQRYNANLNSIVTYKTEHGFKCQFKICECFIYLKKYEEAKTRIQKLKFNINKRIQEQKINTLFKDNVHSKKQLYVKKCDEYLKIVNKALQSREKRLQKAKNKKQSNERKLQMQRQPQRQQIQPLEHDRIAM